jgi:hypothetical protein
MPSPGQPYVTVETKRSYDQVPIPFDYHDWLANQRVAGAAVALDFVIRPLRANATGMQYRCAVAGVTAPVDSSTMTWPQAAGVAFDDGSAEWISEALDDSSFRSTVASQAYVIPNGVASTDAGNNDKIYVVLIGGGISGQSYNIVCDVVLVNGEHKEAVAILPVQD